MKIKTSLIALIPVESLSGDTRERVMTEGEDILDESNVSHVDVVSMKEVSIISVRKLT